MRVLQYENIDTKGIKKPFERTIKYLTEGNFQAAEVKKLAPGNYYRAKLSDADRLIFCFGSCEGERALIILEVVRNHNYDSSRFLRGAKIDESRLVTVNNPEAVPQEDDMTLSYLNPARANVHILDKILSFDEDQELALQQRPPLILIGSAGSGKTVLTLEKLRQLPGEVLYLTHSPYLVDNARSIYYAHHYENNEQEVEFLSFKEFIESIEVPQGRPLLFADFAGWFNQVRKGSAIRDSHALFEEFNGVLSGSSLGERWLTREEYLELGQRRSIFPLEQRNEVYTLFSRYMSWLPGSGCYDMNLICYNHQKLCQPTYDFLVADEVQDITAVQLSLALQALRQPHNFVLCGDANQIVHPNFFSWAGVKSLLHQRQGTVRGELTRILSCNYRNAAEVTEIANRLLRIKEARFGSLDRESHHLIRSVNERSGSVSFLEDSDNVRRELNRKTGRSTRFAVIVLREEDKPSASRHFQTPLVFSVREAKGLEYEHVILPGLISTQAAQFREITRDVSEEDLQGEFTYSRVGDKSDRSLDVYKFYINAFYVALTRATTHIYILEHDKNHPLMRLLKFKTSTTADIVEQHSTEDEWRAEALRLEKQGKLEQVEEIKRSILHIEPVPWEVVTPLNVGKLAQSVLESKLPNKQQQRLLTDYAGFYNILHLLKGLAAQGVRQAKQPNIARNAAIQRYGVDFHQKGYRDLYRKVERHGVDFRNPLNQTALMMAAQLGLEGVTQELVQRGASLTATDNWGRTPLHYVLAAAYQNPHYAGRQLAPIYHAVCPQVTSVRVGQRQIQLDKRRPFFFILHTMLTNFESIVQDRIRRDAPGFQARDFMQAMAAFPESVVPPRLRKRATISAALSGNEISRDAPYNRRLFMRISHGYYIPNPCLELESEGEWVNILKLINLEVLANEETTPLPVREFLVNIMGLREHISKLLNTVTQRAQTEKELKTVEEAAPKTVPAPVRDVKPGKQVPAREVAAESVKGSASDADKPEEALEEEGKVEPDRAEILVSSFVEERHKLESNGAQAVNDESTQGQLTLALASEYSESEAGKLLPEWVELNKLESKQPRLPRNRHEATIFGNWLEILQNRSILEFNLHRLKSLNRMPALGSACLLQFLRWLLNTQEQQDDEYSMAIDLAFGLLATWQIKEAFPLAIKLLLNKAYLDSWMLCAGDDCISSPIANFCDGNVASLSEIILNHELSCRARIATVRVVAHLILERGLSHEIGINFFRRLIGYSNYAPWRTGDDKQVLIAAITMATALYARELKSNLAEALKNINAQQDVLTIEQIAEYASMTQDEHKELIRREFEFMPDKFWDDYYGSMHNNYDDIFDADGNYIHDMRSKPKEIESSKLQQEQPVAASRISRNAPCPCGSGRKYKKCCLEKS